MPKRRFEFTEGNSFKFWEIVVHGSVASVCFGRIGTEGQRQSKVLASQDEALKHAAKQIASKLKKGYREVELAAVS